MACCCSDKNFLTLTFIGGLGISSFLVYLANSPFVLIEHYGLTPTQYSFAFSINAVSFFAVSQATGWFGERFGLVRVMRIAVTAFALTMATMAIVMSLGFNQLPVMAVVPVRRLWLPRPCHPDQRRCWRWKSTARSPARPRR